MELASISNKNDNLVVGTHNGIFHKDEVVAISILKILYENYKEVMVIRSRDLEYLKSNCNILVDIGGGAFDHHQKGGNGSRSNGAKYASAGLVWKEFGNNLIHKLNASLNKEDIQKVWDELDCFIIQEVDKEDNGQDYNDRLFNYITTFLPKWNEDNINYDEAFEKCVSITTSVLKKEIETLISNVLAEKYVNEKLSNIDGNVLEIPSQTFPWLELLTTANENGYSIDFVIFKYPAGGYALQCVPKSLEDKFSQRISLPDSWAGETDNLPEISGVKTAILCHNGKFFARASKKEDIYKMCKLATKEYKENISKQIKANN